MQLLLVFLISSILLGSPLEVGSITLIGSGSLSKPDYASYGGEGFGGYGLAFHAVGYNMDGDTVSIYTQDIEMYRPDFVFSAAPTQCLEGYLVIQSICGISIDGITGYGAFSNIGGSVGLVQVYAIAGQLGGRSYPGELLAEAQIINTRVQVTSVVYNPNGNGNFVAQFDIFDPPPANIPEPKTLVLGLIGIILWKLFSR